MSLMLGASVKPLRDRSYEIFLVLHIVLGLISLVGMF